MRFGSVCSGIEAASVAWLPLGWECAFVSEIEPFPSAVLKHHYPEVPNLGDFTRIDGASWRARIDVLVGGTPCQAFSVAGLRKGLHDERGNLTLAFVELVHAIDPWCVLWENVPGVLSDDTNAFGCLLAGMVGADAPLVPPGGQRWTDAGYVAGPRRHAAWRILDAQYLHLAQRRERVFVVSFRSRDGIHPGAVLFEPESVRRDSPPSREAGEDTAICPTLRAGGNRTGGDRPPGTDVDTADSLIAETHGACLVPIDMRQASRGEKLTNNRKSGSGGPPGVGVGEPGDPAFTVTERVQAVAFNWQSGGDARGLDPSATPSALTRHQTPAIAFDTTQITSKANYSKPKAGDPCHPLAAGQHPPALATAVAVRRLTPRECERLQGFPDDYSLIPTKKRKRIEDDYFAYLLRARPELSRAEAMRLAKDGPRYKALGNSMATNVMRWLGERIQLVRDVWTQEQSA